MGLFRPGLFRERTRPARPTVDGAGAPLAGHPEPAPPEPKSDADREEQERVEQARAWLAERVRRRGGCWVPEVD